MKKRQESAAQAKRVTSLREYARLSRVRFNNGYAGYLEVLYAENELFAAELASVQSYADAYTQLVDVYKSMGGGWIDLADRGDRRRQGAARERAAAATAAVGDDGQDCHPGRFCTMRGLPRRRSFNGVHVMPKRLATLLVAVLILASAPASAAFLSGDALDTAADWVAIFGARGRARSA